MRKTNLAYLAPAALLLLAAHLHGAGVSAEEDAPGGTAADAAAATPTPAPEESAPTSPPTHLKLVGDHWTPWDPPDPESFPPEAKLHIIVRGDTLWDLSDLTFGDPYLWPQIWNHNRYILDSHWIYPGDPLLIPARPLVITPAGTDAASPQILPQGQEGAPSAAFPPPPEEDDGEAEEEEEVAGTSTWGGLTAEAPPGTPSAAPATTPYESRPDTMRPLVDRVELNCSGFIGDKKAGDGLIIAGQQEPAKAGLTTGDLVYLSHGRDAVQPGAEYSVVQRHSEISHPESGRRIGWYYERVGRVKVLAAYDASAVAEVVLACDEIRVGQELVPYDPGPFPLTRRPPFNPLDVMSTGSEVGFLVHTRDDMKVVAPGSIVFVNLGADDGLKPGDFLTAFEPGVDTSVYARGEIDYDYSWGNARFESPGKLKSDPETFPPRLLGQLVVMSTESHTATAKVIYAVAEMQVGTMVEPR
jgi:hypothetical protein